jgi:hypothetical protein
VTSPSTSDPDALPPAVAALAPRPDPFTVDAIATVIDLLEPVERTLVDVVAVGDGELDLASLAQVAGETITAVLGALDVLAHVGLVRRTPDGRVIAAHAHVRRSVLDAMSRAERSRLHGVIALALAGRGVDGAVIVTHIDASGLAELAPWGVELALAAGMAAVDAGDDDRARAAFDRADRLAERGRSVPADSRWR